MITVLCFSCNSPIQTIDPETLEYPFKGEMFTPINANFKLRPGKLDLDIYCPVCFGFPFYYSESVPQHQHVGPYLSVKGPDGRPAMMPVAEIKAMKSDPKPQNVTKKVDKPQKTNQTEGKTCPECGAKANRSGKITFHKKGCPIVTGKSRESEPLSQGEPSEPANKKATPGEKPAPDPFLADLEKQVTRGARDAEADPRATREEIAEMGRERDTRQARDRREADLRPMRN